MRYIYSRVSTDKQVTTNQTQRLSAKYPDAVVVCETASGAKRRPELEQLLTLLKGGDTLIVAALDRLGRSTIDIINIMNRLDALGVVFVSEREGIDYSTATGRFVARTMASFAELERELISERTKAALRTKREQGIIGGRPTKLKNKVLGEIYELRAAGLSMAAIGEELGLSSATVHRALSK